MSSSSMATTLPKPNTAPSNLASLLSIWIKKQIYNTDIERERKTILFGKKWNS